MANQAAILEDCNAYDTDPALREGIFRLWRPHRQCQGPFTGS